MAGMLDDMKGKMSDKMGGMDDAMRERYQMLMNKKEQGKLDDSERSELDQMDSRMTDSGKQ